MPQTLLRHRLLLPDETATTALARWLAPRLRAGDVLALSGPIGAGKSALARALILTRLNAVGRAEEVPSPTFTLVQTYAAGGLEIWHCDLYRLTLPDEVWELGLDDAFDTALCLIEWPDRLGAGLPADCLRIDLAADADGGGRVLTLTGEGQRWRALLADLPADLPLAAADG